ncbi:hypothetical protein DDE83_000024 [Stemphylium lycopersici]|uniref:Uncharacterized protein n=1 Tax=Stemphylium lycopersici TaxID=183478 RepID=A0A364NGQ1_STELY|nr:hypothetical protein DDE83_000024 [Stemphylium lycopersici]
MAHLGPRAGGTLPRIALVSPASVQTTFDHASGAFGSRKTTFPPAETYLRRTFRGPAAALRPSTLSKLWRLGPVWAVSASSCPDAELIDINLNQEKTQEQERALEATCFLRSIPLISSLLVGRIDNTAYESILKTFLNSKQEPNLREDPDFLSVPGWHPEFHAQRPWLDIAIALPEDRNSDIFTYETLLKKSFFDYDKHKAAPNAAKLHRLRWSATSEIEDLIPSAVHTDAELKALRKIEIKSLNIPRVLAYRDSSVITLLKAKMQKILRNKKHVADLNETCICDMISLYSDDEDEEHFNGPAAVEARFSQRKRQNVTNWASAIPAPASHHTELHSADGTFCEPLEPIGEPSHMTEADDPLQPASDIIWPLASCSLLFPCNGEGRMVLELGCLPDREYSEGHFTNMTSAASSSDADASSNEGDGDKAKATSRRDSDTSLESFTSSISDGKAI